MSLQHEAVDVQSDAAAVADQLAHHDPLDNIVEAVKHPKKPPPEAPEGITARRLILAAFWAVVIFLGFPLWWHTTTVYRANLPSDSMNAWANGEACTPSFPLTILLDSPTLDVTALHSLGNITQHALDDLNDSPVHNLRLLVKDSPARNAIDDDTTLTVRLNAAADIDQPGALLHSYAPVLDVNYAPSMLPTSAATTSPLATFIAAQLRDTFSEEQAIIAHLLSKSTAAASSLSTNDLKTSSPDLIDTLERRTTRAFKHAPTFHLTFSLFTPGASPSGWDIETALSTTISPLLAALSPVFNFTVDTQVQPYAAFSPTVQPGYDEALSAFTLSTADLGSFINAAEWPLTPSIGAGPTINFILYVPSPDHSPLLLADSHPSSAPTWLIPQWGAIYILNTPTTPSLDASTLRVPLQAFSGHLISLLGLPATPSSLPLQLSTLGRTTTLSLILRASSTLASLARLALALPSISIPDAVAHNTDTALAQLRAACAATSAGRFRAALAAARAAEDAAEAAFFEPSMVGQLYFPDEHKVAVYLPLLGPIAVPLLLAGLKELRAWRTARR